MAIIGNESLTLLDITQGVNSMGKEAVISEVLAKKNTMIGDMTFVEATGLTNHRTTVRTGLPTSYWRMVNQGTPESKSTKAQIDEPCGMLSARSKLDKKLAKLGGNLNTRRFNEAKSYLEAMAQEAESTAWYGNALIDAEQFNGFTPRYDTTSDSAEVSQNVIAIPDTSQVGAGSNNRSSIWLITWGDTLTSGFYPKGSMAGLQHDDLGLQDAFDENQNRYRAYLDEYSWDLGLTVQDWRYNVRIPNIVASYENISQTDSNGRPVVDLRAYMARAIHRIPNLNSGKMCFYMNRDLFAAYDYQSEYKVTAGGGVTYDNVDGMQHYNFRGIPVRVTDGLLNAEAKI